MRKRFLLIGIILMLTLVLASCGKDKGEKVESQDVEEQNQEVEKQDVENQEIQGNESTEDTLEGGEVVLDEEQEKVEPQVDWLAAVTVWTTGEVNLRVEPNTDCDIITTLSKGIELKKGSEENGWAYVQYGDHIGYVSKKYLANEKPVEEPKEEPKVDKVEVIPGQYRDANDIVVVIDPGHQGKGDSTKEPNGPGSSTMKARVTSGCTGVASKVPEYKLVLQVSLLLKTELENRGYTVYMTRSSHDVNISNMERAQFASSKEADIAVRIHADSIDKESVRGATALAPSSSNEYVSYLANASQALGREIINHYCDATGFKNRGVKEDDTMTGINWSEVPVTILELGFMSNPEEDMAMQDDAMQNNMVQGIANGIDAYFGF